MLSMCDMGSGKTLGLRKKLKKKSREKEDRLHINQPRLFCHFILSCFFSLVISFSTYFWVAPPFQAVLFELWMTARELTRLLVFVAHACNHMWKKDLQLRAFAEQRWLFIPSFPRAEGLFLKGAYRAGLGGWWEDWSWWWRGGCFSSFLSSQTNLHPVLKFYWCVRVDSVIGTHSVQYNFLPLCV